MPLTAILRLRPSACHRRGGGFASLRSPLLRLISALLFGLLSTLQVSASCCVPDEFRLASDEMCGIGRSAVGKADPSRSEAPCDTCESCLTCAAPVALPPPATGGILIRDAVFIELPTGHAVSAALVAYESPQQPRAPPVASL